MQVELLTREQVVGIVNDVLAGRERVEEWLTTNEAAAYLKVDVRTIRRRIDDGRLPGKRVSGMWRVPLSALKSLDSL